MLLSMTFSPARNKEWKCPCVRRWFDCTIHAKELRTTTTDYSTPTAKSEAMQQFSSNEENATTDKSISTSVHKKNREGDTNDVAT